MGRRTTLHFRNRLSLVGRMSMSLSVNPTSPVKSLGELIDYARAHPGMLNDASVGSVDTLLAGLLMKATSTSMTQVNYKGPVQSLQDLMAGRIDVAINPLGTQIELAKNGRLRMLAVFGANRDVDVPDVPTMTESGVPEVSFDGMWFGLFGPAKMPAERINRLAQVVHALLKRPDMREKLALRALKPD
ncbi:MAG: tripartite tricarboxylate transporter substrate binding protein [Burkholderiales bacterium]